MKYFKNEKEKRSEYQNSRRDIICLYHNDLDGKAAGAVIQAKLGYNPIFNTIPANKNNILTFKAVEHGDNWDVMLHKFDGKTLILVDFTFPKDTMDSILYSVKKGYITDFIWIDHHATVKKEMPNYWNDTSIKGIRSIKKSGCELTWDYFYPDKKLYPNKEIPEAIKLVGDMDLWKFKYGIRTKQFCEYANARVTNAQNWEILRMFKHIDYWCDMGEGLLLAKKRRIEKSFNDGKDGIFEGHKCRIVNTNHDISATGEFIYKDNKYPIAFMWSVRDGKVIVSLRSNTIDVGKIAKKHGGGGHKFASGFTIDDKLEIWDNNKRII